MSDVKLRVLTGGNTGAEIMLAEGVWVIGTDPDVDLTLAEPNLKERQLQITVEPGAVKLRALAEGASLGGHELGQDVETNWEAGIPLAIGLTSLIIGDGPVREVTVTAEENAAQTKAPAQSNTPTSKRRNSPVIYAAGLGLAALCLAVLWLLMFSSKDATSPPPLTASADIAAKIIETQGLEARVSVKADGDKLSIIGQVPDAASQDQLVQSMRRAGLSPQFTLITDATLYDLVNTVMRAFAIEPTITVTGRGTVTVSGFVSDEAKAHEAIRRLRADVPGIVAVDDRLSSGSGAEAFVRSQLANAGLTEKMKVTGVQGNVVTVSGTLDGPEIETWTAIVRRFEERFSPTIRLQAHLASMAAAAPRGLSLGSTPYVILEDGKRLSIGSDYGKGKIVGIQAKGLIVQIASGDITVPFTQSPRWVMEEADGIRN